MNEQNLVIDLFVNHRTKNPLNALLLFTDGEDNNPCDYSQLMRRLPENTNCHTFGYGSDHSSALLVRIAELGNGGTFHLYLNASAFATAMAGLLTCIAKQIRVEMEFYNGNQVIESLSHYQHEPEQLPSARVIVKLNDLSIEEKRNLLFRYQRNKIFQHGVKQSINHNRIILLVMYQSLISNQIVYSSLSTKLCQVNQAVDIQRNRVQTAAVLKQAMSETDYDRSVKLLKTQARSIQRSASTQDQLCQQLIRA
ncbi:unnamed protein product [Adineta ricciae]|uniref:VWFA domain-containing protein n=1 Tax=Adineta ricciae TaxID=249248 RepID=A0A815M2X8_ADIRI|nr:unnamed protein product [Adineta ricciae]CAF1415982.1 unnamed protein product [Adineta ricciae]